MAVTWDEKLTAAARARRAVFEKIGVPSEDVLAPIIGPLLTGGPPWPSRPAWRVIRREGRIMLATDALSDPWQDRAGAGHGLEVFIETGAELVPEGAPATAMASTWVFAAVSEIANVVAGHGGVRGLLDEIGTVSVEVDGARFPSSLRNSAGRVGVVLGVAARGVPEKIVYPGGGDARLVAITVLTIDELDHIVRGGEPARQEVVDRLAASPTGHMSVLERESVMKPRPVARVRTAPVVEAKARPAPVAKPAAKPVAAPVAKAKTVAVAAPVAKAKTVAAPVAKAKAKVKPVAKAAAKPVAKAKAKPVAKTKAKPAAKPAVKAKAKAKPKRK